MNIQNINRAAWDREVDRKNSYTQPIGAELIARARQGYWELRLTSIKPIPQEWLPDLHGLDVLCLAGGGGQQGPLLAAAGGNVTVLDLSPNQLAQDRFVAQRDGLAIRTVEGDMTDLSMFPDGSFDLVVHPISNLFVQDVRPVWREALRVLRSHGVLIAAFMNPMQYVFDLHRLDEEGVLEVKHPLPFSSVTSLNDTERERYFGEDGALEFSHTLADQISGQLEAGFIMTGFFEDGRPNDLLSSYIPAAFATRSVKGI